MSHILWAVLNIFWLFSYGYAKMIVAKKIKGVLYMVKGMGNMGNMQGMMQKMQKMQKDMEKEQTAIQNTEFTATSVNDLVKVKVSGKKEILEIELAPALVDPDDIEMLQDLVLATVNEALNQVDQTTQARMGKFTQGLNLPF